MSKSFRSSCGTPILILSCSILADLRAIRRNNRTIIFLSQLPESDRERFRYACQKVEEIGSHLVVSVER